MKTMVPFVKDVKFSSRIHEICSMSLEHELNIKEDEIRGDFIISGEYRPNEISITKEKFFYRIPFTVDVTDNLNRDSINFNIEDFYYDLIGDDTLQVNIEFSVEGNELPRAEAKEEIEELFREPEAIYEDVPVPVIEEAKENERLKKSETESIISKVSSEEETYTKYHVHIVRENDTLESICTLYNVNPDVIKLYNNKEEIALNDKILIPENYE